MQRTALTLLLASSVLISIPTAPLFAQDNAPFQIAAQVDDLIDLSPNHWAYGAVKALVEELEIMDPKTENQFKGNDLLTRYELATVFHKAVKKLEGASGKDLKLISDAPATDIADLDSANSEVVNSVVNDYGIMQTMPGKKFMGNEPISRYELAFELYNYFTLIESKGVNPSLSERARAEQFSDLPADHWATRAVKSIVDKYQVMEGYPDDTFKGGKRLTRYEAAAVLRSFIKYVDTYLIPLTPGPTPEATPTPMPTAVPTPMPTPTPIPEPTKKPLSNWDLRLGGDFGVTGVPGTNPMETGFMYGPNASLDVWFPKMGPIRLGLDLHGDYQMYQADKFTNPANLARLTAGGGLNWRILGADSDEDVSLVLGVGYDYMSFLGTNYSYANHGPRGKVGLEIPVGPYFSIVGRNAFTYFPFKNAGINDNVTWKNDAFVGVTIPAYTLFSVELGYRDTRYMLDGNQTMFGNMGGELNLRFRF